MRRILVEQCTAEGAREAGDGLVERVSLDEDDVAASVTASPRLLDLDEALTELGATAARKPLSWSNCVFRGTYAPSMRHSHGDEHPGG